MAILTTADLELVQISSLGAEISGKVQELSHKEKEMIAFRISVNYQVTNVVEVDMVPPKSLVLALDFLRYPLTPG